MKTFSVSAVWMLSLSVCLTCRIGEAWILPQQEPTASTRLTATVDKSGFAQQQNSVLDGVSEFEGWFAAVPGASCERSIVHEDFGNLRGLACASALANSTKDWMTIPRSVILQSDFSQSDWDAKLAQQLWQEVLKGSSSSIAGYVALLTQGTSWMKESGDPASATPPSTAPDALRHWSEEEKELLSASTEGKRLLGLEKQQNEIWRGKFKSTTGMTYEQFTWAMEVVHSRAFCGDFGIGAGSSVSTVITIAAPAVAGAAGFVY